jgi:hypothetical protein
MFRTYWWFYRRARQAAKILQRALLLLETQVEACSAHQGSQALSGEPVRRAKAQIIQARRLIEDLPNLSFNAQSRFFRKFECLEECLDYAVESMLYEEFSAASVDLSRSVKGLQGTISFLEAQTHSKPQRPILRKLARRIALRWSQHEQLPVNTQAEIILLPGVAEQHAQPKVMLM